MSLQTVQATNLKTTRKEDGEQAADKTAIRPFHVNVPEAELTELRRRINATRWPERELVNDISQGVQASQEKWRNFVRQRI
jgi:hypothetical protein